MPNRLIKESICTSDKINALSDFLFRLWACLITYVDDYGRGDARLAIIKGRCFPLRSQVDIPDIEKGLKELSDRGCIRLYEVNGDPYLCFPNWNVHQTVRNKKSKYPEPPTIDSKQEHLKSIEINCNQLNADESKCSRNPIQSESESESVSESLSKPLIDDEEAHKIQKEHDSILEAAKNAGFKGSPSENADLIKLYAEYGYEKMIAGFTACVEHSAANLAYLRAVLKGEPRKQVVTQTRVLPAQNFEQRDYSGVDDELKAKLAAEMAEFKRNGGLQNAAG